METNRVAIKDLDGTSLYYAIGVGKVWVPWGNHCFAVPTHLVGQGGVFTGQVLNLIHEHQVEYDSFTSVEYLLKEYVGCIEYDTTFQEYIVTSRIDENIFAVSALLPEAIAMCAAKVIYKDVNSLDIPVCLMDNWWMI